MPPVTKPVRIPGPLGRRRARWRRQWLPLSRLSGAALPRLFDLLLALTLLAALSPLLLLRGLAARGQAGQALERATLIGRFRTPFERLAFAGRGPGQGLAVLFNILRGDMAFVGPRPLTPAEAAQIPVQAAVRFTVRPGLFSPYGLRRRVGIAYETEHETDREFVYSETAQGNLGILARAAAGALLSGGEARPAPPQLDFFGIAIVNTTMEEAVDWLAARARDSAPSLVAFVNPDCLNIAYWNDAYRQALQQAARVLPDGIGIHLGCRIQGVSLAANVNGTDLFPRLCERCAREGLALFLLGARPGVAVAVAENMKQRYPALVIAGARHGYFEPAEEDAIIQEINASDADILLVAFGVPKQELWLARHQPQLKPRVLMGVGGLFDFYSGRIPRAPVWMREIGLEWVWRLLQEPGRMWRRYLIGNPLFLYRVWKQARRSL